MIIIDSPLVIFAGRTSSAAGIIIIFFGFQNEGKTQYCNENCKYNNTYKYC